MIVCEICGEPGTVFRLDIPKCKGIRHRGAWRAIELSPKRMIDLERRLERELARRRDDEARVISVVVLEDGRYGVRNEGDISDLNETRLDLIYDVLDTWFRVQRARRRAR